MVREVVIFVDEVVGVVVVSHCGTCSRSSGSNILVVVEVYIVVV